MNSSPPTTTPATASPGTRANSMVELKPSPHAEQMDSIYRWTRHIYDVSRKFYLFGRDSLLKDLNAPQNSTVLEMGCGTARNLAKLSAMRPDLKLLGLDASAQMLETASKKLADPALRERITLRQGLAEELDLPLMFGVSGPLPRVFFSYSLTMIPPWKGALDAALRVVPVGGEIHIVDFWDQGSWPGPTRWALRRWLKLFTVEFRPELMAYLESLARDGKIDLHVKSIFGRYAFSARVVRRV
ncbi:MAG: class I SAM-dependent methyltransferase [Phycisphaerales bacterium]|nr:class I SAM-dependent methyltransferase [Phycisphaerales bacterium]